MNCEKKPVPCLRRVIVDDEHIGLVIDNPDKLVD